MRIRRANRVLVAAFLSAIAFTGAFAQSSGDEVLNLAEDIGRTAGQLLSGAPAVLNAGGDLSIGVSLVSWDGARPSAADLITALVEDELVAAASRIIGFANVAVVPGGPTDLTIEVEGSGGGSQALFIVQLLDTRGGRPQIVSSGRVRADLTNDLRMALEASSGQLMGGGTRGDDVGNGPEEARAVTLGDTIFGLNLEQSGDEDWFVIDVPTSQARFEGDRAINAFTEGSTDTYIELYGPNDPNALLVSNDDFEGMNASVTAAVQDGARYWIKVRGFANSATGQYDLTVFQAVLEPDLTEPNDSQDSATEVLPGQSPIQASIRPSSDYDWYFVSAQTLESLGGTGDDSAVFVGTTGDIDTVLTVYNQAGEQIAYSDDDGDGANARTTVPVTGEPIWVEVRGFGSWTEGPYQFVLEVAEVVLDEWEPDDSLEQAQPIGFGEPPRTYSFTTGSDEDWVWFETTAARTRIIAETQGEIDTYMHLYDRNGSQLETNDDGGEGFNSRIDTTLGPGRYYIMLRPLFLGSSESAYSFTLEQP